MKSQQEGIRPRLRRSERWLVILIAGFWSSLSAAQTPGSPREDAALRILHPETLPSVPKVLTLAEAMELASLHNPGLAGTAQQIRAAEGRSADAGRRPNPSFEGSAENWGGSLGSEHTEATVGISQPIELGGDRAARRELALADVEGARAELSRVIRNLKAAATERFLAAWSTQERLWRLREARQVAADAAEAAADRIKAGVAPTVERVRADGNLALTEADVARTEAELAGARRALAVLWGAVDAAFDSLALPLSDLPSPPSQASLLAGLKGHPELARASAESRAAHARVRVVRASRMPDLDARLGVRYLREAGGTGLIAAIALPLPLWNAQEGSVAAAEADRARAEVNLAATQRQLESELLSALDRLGASITVYSRLHDRAAPAAEEALAQLRAAYRAGRLSYLDLLDGQRAALDARLAAIDATAEVWRSQAALERLAGEDLKGGGR